MTAAPAPECSHSSGLDGIVGAHLCDGEVTRCCLCDGISAKCVVKVIIFPGCPDLKYGDSSQCQTGCNHSTWLDYLLCPRYGRAQMSFYRQQKADALDVGAIELAAVSAARRRRQRPPGQKPRWIRGTSSRVVSKAPLSATFCAMLASPAAAASQACAQWSSLSWKPPPHR